MPNAGGGGGGAILIQFLMVSDHRVRIQNDNGPSLVSDHRVRIQNDNGPSLVSDHRVRIAIYPTLVEGQEL